MRGINIHVIFISIQRTKNKNPQHKSTFYTTLACAGSHIRRAIARETHKFVLRNSSFLLHISRLPTADIPLPTA